MELIDPEIKIDHERVFHSTQALFLLLKPDKPLYTILDASNTYCAATLTKRSEIINKSLFTVFPDDNDKDTSESAGSLRASLEKILKTKQPDIMPVIRYDIPVPKKDGGGFEIRYWTPVNIPILNDKGEVMYILNQVEDVSGSVILQNEIEKKSKLLEENDARINLILNALLKYTVLDFSERLKTTDKGDELDAIIVGLNSVIDELENYMLLLKNSNAELAYANKELDSFSYSVSHDLRAPLRSISGYAQVLIEDYCDKLDEDGKRTIDIITKNAFKMAALIDDLLTFSRMGKQDLKKIPLRMRHIVDSVIMEFTNQEQKNNLEFIIKPLSDIEGDNSMIKQVFTNLISNSIKYSGKKEKAIIEIGSYKEKENMVYYVKDNGVGFDMKYYKKLFGVFQRLHSAYEFEGTGVGVAMVQRIIKKHSGEVWADAEVDVGATFYFSIPIKY